METYAAKGLRLHGSSNVTRITFNTNIAALGVQRQLARSSQELGNVYTRLSSGQRINSAADDSAGLAIATKLSSDKRLFNQASRNINDGISLLSIADGALEQLGTILTRLTELASQSASGTLSASQRKALDTEAQALSEEYTRVARSTSFNGQNVFDASFGTLGIAAGITGSSDSQIRSGLGGGIGTGSFLAATTITQTTNTLGAAVADFNRDGILDVASARSDASVEVRFGIGDGTFASGRTYAIGLDIHDLDTTDFNNDGIVDLFSADRNDGTVSVLLGNGDGTFRTRITASVGADPFRIQSGDFNNDGRVDLVAANFATNRLTIITGNGDGTFSTGVTLNNGGSPFGVTVADFNGDGNLDLASTGNSDDSVGIFFGNGNGTFGARQYYAQGAAGDAIISADINKDGRIDIIAGGFGAPYFARVYINQGNGTFSSANTFQTNGIDDFSLADVNGDGNLDLIGASFNDNAIYVLNGNGNGTFGAARSYSAGGTGTYVVKTGDLNGDGAVDIVSANNSGNSLGIFLGERANGVGSLHTFSLKTQYESLQALGQFKRDTERLLLQRGTIGAFQSRLEVAVRNTFSSAATYADAESRIRDADIAQESASLTRLRILQDVGSAILAQVNQQPTIALSLLTGIDR